MAPAHPGAVTVTTQQFACGIVTEIEERNDYNEERGMEGEDSFDFHVSLFSFSVSMGMAKLMGTQQTLTERK